MNRERSYRYLETEPPGTTIHYLRMARGWSIRTLAEQASIHYSTISRYEGNKGLTRPGLEKIAKALEVPLQALFCPPELAPYFSLSEVKKKAFVAQLNASAHSRT